MTTKSKHKPQRTCIACRQIKEKKDLIRIVHTKDGTVEVDPSAKKPGRASYLCPKKNCWEKGLKKDYLEHALRTKLSDDDHQALLEYSKSLK